MISKQSYLSVSLNLGVDESPEDVGSDGKVGEDELCLLMKAEQGEVVSQLHGLNSTFLLLEGLHKKYTILIIQINRH